MQERLGDLWRRWRGSLGSDAVSAVALTALLLLGAYGEAHPRQASDKAINGHPIPHTPNAALLLVAVAGLVLVLRRRYPQSVLAVSTAAVVAYTALGYVNGAALLAPSVALFSVSRAVPVRRSLIAAGLTLVALGAVSATDPFGVTGGGNLLIPALIAAPLFGGIAVRNRNAYVASIEARAEAEAQRRVDEERLRIARELHDIVAHSMATISVQAGVAEHVLATNPTAVAEALHSIRLTSRDGLRDLRAILNVLRQADEGDPVEPTPGLAQLDTLTDRASQAGLPTTVRREGHARPLPSGVDLAAYRIIQESLTNAIKHAGPATATIMLDYDESVLRIEIADTGRGTAHGTDSPGAGQGIIGMRERAASVGGTLQAGPEPSGGYRVVAVLPAEQAVPAGQGTVETGSRS